MKKLKTAKSNGLVTASQCQAQIEVMLIPRDDQIMRTAGIVMDLDKRLRALEGLPPRNKDGSEPREGVIDKVPSLILVPG